MEHRTYIEVFFNWYDAARWLEGHIIDHDEEEWIIEQASINYINQAWRAGFVISKRQKELALDS